MVALVWGVIVMLGIFAIPFFILSSRRRFLRTLAREAAPGLERIAGGLLSEPGRAAIDDQAGIASVEGTFEGQRVRVSASYPPKLSDRYVSTGYPTYIGSQVTVTVGLLGASPRFSLAAKPNAAFVADEVLPALHVTPPTDRDFARAWKVDADPAVLTDAVRSDLMRFIADQRNVLSVSVGPEGLSIAWAGERGVASDAEAERVRAVAAFAMKLRAHFLGTAEAAARGGVRIDADAYRGDAPGVRVEDGAADASQEAASEEAEEAAREAQS